MPAFLYSRCVQQNIAIPRLVCKLSARVWLICAFARLVDEIFKRRILDSSVLKYRSSVLIDAQWLEIWIIVVKIGLDSLQHKLFRIQLVQAHKSKTATKETDE